MTDQTSYKGLVRSIAVATAKAWLVLGSRMGWRREGKGEDGGACFGKWRVERVRSKRFDLGYVGVESE